MVGKKGMDRRGFLVGGGAAVAAAGLALLRPKAAFGLDALPALPWPWMTEPIDPVATAGASASGLSGCASVSFGLIVRKLKTVMPDSVWAALPEGMAAFGNGGGPYGSDCGALQGPLFIMNLLGAPAGLRQEFYKWYCGFPFPSNEWDGLYTFKNTITSVANSPLCHESRAIWEGVYLRTAYDGVNYDNTRCGKLPRDCVKKAVELINAWKFSGYAGGWAPEASFMTCYDCHTQLYTSKTPGGISSGKEDCTKCHEVAASHGQVTPKGPKKR